METCPTTALEIHQTIKDSCLSTLQKYVAPNVNCIVSNAPDCCSYAIPFIDKEVDTENVDLTVNVLNTP